MDEQDFELRDWKPFGTDAVKNAERLPALGIALWGRTTEDLRQQLLAPMPKIPRACSLVDLQVLERQAMLMLKSPATFPKLNAELVVVGTQTFTGLEARLEVVRRAIQHFRK